MPASVLDGLPYGWLELGCSRLWKKGPLRAQTWKNSTYRLETAEVILHPAALSSSFLQCQAKKSRGGGEKMDRSPGCSLWELWKLKAMATVGLAGTILLCHALSTQQPRNSAALENPWEVQVSIGRFIEQLEGFIGWILMLPALAPEPLSTI